MPRKSSLHDKRNKLRNRVDKLAEIAIFGTLSENYTTCGSAGCGCHHGGPKHGPYLYVTFRGDEGKTKGYYVPKPAHERMRQSIDAWHELQGVLRELAEMNKEQLLAAAKERKG